MAQRHVVVVVAKDLRRKGADRPHQRLVLLARRPASMQRRVIIALLQLSVFAHARQMTGRHKRRLRPLLPDPSGHISVELAKGLRKALLQLLLRLLELMADPHSGLRQIGHRADHGLHLPIFALHRTQPLLSGLITGLHAADNFNIEMF